jgi:type IV secretory pathway VirB2 component (pilin)
MRTIKNIAAGIFFYLCLVACFLFIFLLTGTQAHAGVLTGLVTYVQGNIIADVEVLAVIAIGFLLFSHHVPWWAVIGICGGIYVIANANTIVAAIAGGGG